MPVDTLNIPDTVSLWRAVCENATVAMFIMNDRQQCIYMNPAAEELSGYTLEETRGRALHDVVHHTKPDGSPYPLEECPIDRAFPENNCEQGEEIFVHKDGSFYPVAFTASPLRAHDSEVVGTIIEVRDLRPEKQAQAEREANQALIEATFENAAVGIGHVGEDGRWLRVNSRLCEIVGYSRDELLDLRSEDMTHPEDQDADRELFGQLTSGEIGSYSLEKRYYRKNGELIWVNLSTSLQRDAEGAPLYCIAVVEDISRRKAGEQHLEVMTQELNHRVKNTLATVQAIASQSLRGETSLEDGRKNFVARLSALSSVHNLLLKESWSGASMREVVASALMPFGYGDSRDPSSNDRQDVDLDGPDIQLPAKAAQMMSMAIHELVTNAVKYGALSQPDGRICVRWAWLDQEAGRFELTWRETGGPTVTPPEREGFGSLMLKRILPRDIQGEVLVDYAESGVICRIEGKV
ncbi:PAS domain S-box protein [Maricaulis sp. CAU 1757]